MPDLEYIPAPAKPDWFDKKLLEIGGTVSNAQPRYRAVWGMDEKEFYAGVEDTKYASMYAGQVGMPRWIIERWVPPSLFNPREWREYPQLGPYPSRGVYVLLFVVRADDGEFAPLDEAVIEQLRHSHFFLTHQDLEAAEYAKQCDRRHAMRKKRDEYLEEETKEGWREFFSKEDYYNAQREYSFARRLMNPGVAGEKKTDGGIIIPAGVNV